jgi:hypothetical protein
MKNDCSVSPLAGRKNGRTEIPVYSNWSVNLSYGSVSRTGLPVRIKRRLYPPEEIKK